MMMVVSHTPNMLSTKGRSATPGSRSNTDTIRLYMAKKCLLITARLERTKARPIPMRSPFAISFRENSVYEISSPSAKPLMNALPISRVKEDQAAYQTQSVHQVPCTDKAYYENDLISYFGSGFAFHIFLWLSLITLDVIECQIADVRKDLQPPGTCFHS